MRTDDLYVSKYSFPKVRQVNNYYCGPASVVMALIGSGASGYYYTLNDEITNRWQEELGEPKDKLATIKPDKSKGIRGGTEIGNITKVMKENIPSRNGFTYKTKAFTYLSYKKALGFIEDSLVVDCVPIIRVSDTYLLDYYKDAPESYTHYMAVSSVDFNAECVTLVDPHYDNPYFGYHTIYFSDFEKLARECRDFWVSVYTDASSDNEYIYLISFKMTNISVTNLEQTHINK